MLRVSQSKRFESTPHSSTGIYSTGFDSYNNLLLSFQVLLLFCDFSLLFCKSAFGIWVVVILVLRLSIMIFHLLQYETVWILLFDRKNKQIIKRSRVYTGSRRTRVSERETRSKAGGNARVYTSHSCCFSEKPSEISRLAFVRCSRAWK